MKLINMDDPAIQYILYKFEKDKKFIDKIKEIEEINSWTELELMKRQYFKDHVND